MLARFRSRSDRVERGTGHSLRRGSVGMGVLAAICGLALTACSGTPPKFGSSTTVPPSSTTTTTTKPTTQPATTSRSVLFFGRGSSLGAALRTVPAASVRYDTMKALFAGPSTTEKAAGLRTAIPSGAILEGLSFNGSLGYVSVNSQFFLLTTKTTFAQRLAEVVYTLTEFPGVDSAQFYLHGSTVPDIDGLPTAGPLTRADLASAIGNFLIVSPAVGESVKSPLTVSGISEFSGALEVQLTNAGGQLIVNTVATTTVGETFTYTYPFSTGYAGGAMLDVYAAAGHSTTSDLVASIPVTLTG